MAAATTALKKTHCFRRMIGSPSRTSSTTASTVSYHRRSRSNSRPTSPLASNLSTSLSQKLSSSSTELHSDGAYFFDAKKFSPLSSPLKGTYRNSFHGATSCSSSSLQNLEEKRFASNYKAQDKLTLKLRRYNSATSLVTNTHEEEDVHYPQSYSGLPSMDQKNHQKLPKLYPPSILSLPSTPLGIDNESYSRGLNIEDSSFVSHVPAEYQSSYKHSLPSLHASSLPCHQNQNNLAMHSRANDKQNLHNNAENFSQRELDSKIDKVIKEEREGSFLHINNPILYSHSASTDKTYVNMAHHNKINTQQTQRKSEVILRDMSSGSSFYRKQMSNTDEFAAALGPCRNCFLDNAVCKCKKYRGLRPQELYLTKHQNPNERNQQAQKPLKVQYKNSIDSKFNIHNNAGISAFLHEERKTISSSALLNSKNYYSKGASKYKVNERQLESKIIDHNYSKFEKIGNPTSSTQFTYSKYCDDPSDVMLNNSHNDDKFSTAKAASFVNVTKKRKVKEKLEYTKGRNFDGIQNMSKADEHQALNKSSVNFCSMNQQFNNDSVINRDDRRTNFSNNSYKSFTNFTKNASVSDAMESISKNENGEKGNNGHSDNSEKNSSNHENIFRQNTAGAVSGGFMAVLFGMSSPSPFETSCQNDTADRVKLFVDKRKLVLSNAFSNAKQQQRLEKNGNAYNGKLYDENNVRTVKIDQKRLQCEVKTSSEGENIDNLSSSSPVMTCGANVVANVKEALVNGIRYNPETKEVSETPAAVSKKQATEENVLLQKSRTERISIKEDPFCRIEANYHNRSTETSRINSSEKEVFHSAEKKKHFDETTVGSCQTIRHNDILTIDQSIFVNLGNKKEDAVRNTATESELTALATTSIEKGSQYMTRQESQIEKADIVGTKDANCSTTDSTLDVITETNTITTSPNDIPSTIKVNNVMQPQSTMSPTSTLLLTMPLVSTKKDAVESETNCENDCEHQMKVQDTLEASSSPQSLENTSSAAMSSDTSFPPITLQENDNSEGDESEDQLTDYEKECEDAEGKDDKEKDKKKENNNGDGNGKKPKKEKIGFRDRKIIDYENRIRTYSAPDKIFRYFATYKAVVDNEIFMTPDDFLRSLTPGMIQPMGLGLDQFKKFDYNTMDCKKLHSTKLPQDSIFYRLGASGLITFSDYIFLLTILSTSRRQFEIAFRMFDLNGDGDVDAEEFEQVQSIIRQSTSVGKKHKDHANTGCSLSKKSNSALSNYFFGEARDGKLTIERFLEFQTQLQREILRLEFERKHPDEETNLIKESQFAELLLAYADYNTKKRSNVLKRVKKAYKKKKKKDQEDTDDGSNNTLEQTRQTSLSALCSTDNGTGNSGNGISLDDYYMIFSVLSHIDDVDKALCFYNLSGASIDPATLKHVAKVCANVDLGDHVVEVIFTIFDEDGDGQLSNKEFIAVMKNKLKRGLDKPKDTGISNLFSALAKCAQQTPAASVVHAPGGHEEYSGLFTKKKITRFNLR